MLFRQLRASSSGRFSYLVASPSSGDAVLIDPVIESLGLAVRLLWALDLRLVRGLATSSCPALVEGLDALRERTGCRVALGKTTAWTGADCQISDGEHLEFGGLRLKAVHTPGVRPDCYCYVMDDRVFTGTTLLVGDVGRCDSSVGNPRQHYTSLFAKVLPLPGELLVFPSIGETGRSVSTLAEQRVSNSRLLVANVEQFVSASQEAQPSLGNSTLESESVSRSLTVALRDGASFRAFGDEVPVLCDTA